ncbi:hypothetical protein JCGZ_10764 [Jatropha curcas]|uniref:ARID domain-containing protein n=2 Tax=Jatropha curcas TaxID=180498 RepID=A0A067LF61_JATCU|nr:hypothetical protein JCGZ_10764 [Jatropha curcas]
MANSKEAGEGEDVDVILNGSLVEEEAKVPPSSENEDSRAEEKQNVVTKDVEVEEQIPAEKVGDGEIPDDKGLETFPDDMAGKASSDINGTSSGNIQAESNGTHRNESNDGADAKGHCNAKNEDAHVNVLNGKPMELETKAEDSEKVEDDKKVEAFKDVVTITDLSPHSVIKKEMANPKLDEEHEVSMNTPNKSFLVGPASVDGYESGTEEEQAAFLKDVESVYKENNLEFKAPKFYKEELNLLKLWRAVIKLGGYEQVTSYKLWRQVGESFNPPKTCTTVSWTFRNFYEKALLEYEKHKVRCGELPFPDGSLTEPVRVENQTPGNQALGSGRARRDAAARAMQGWHSQRLLGNGQVCDPIIKDKSLNSTQKGDKQLKTNGLLKRKKPSTVERAVHVPHVKMMKLQADTMVIDIGPPADWVKINVQRTNDCFEIYALVPGLLREEVHVQSDPAGRLIISGQPEQLDNPWGVTPFKKVVSLPSRIDPHQTSAVVTLHGQLFVRVPFENLDI